jgi:hypothetical protein
MKQRKALILAGIAVVAAVIGLFGFTGQDSADAAWGFAIGIGIGALVTWHAERDA